tara:strand:- start:125 stop:349 length:225 start_codon:yes stop_codon:yes gene_type:complete
LKERNLKKNSETLKKRNFLVSERFYLLRFLSSYPAPSFLFFDSVSGETIREREREKDDDDVNNNNNSDEDNGNL